MLFAGPSARSRSTSPQVAAKPARRCRWTTRRRSHGASFVGAYASQCLGGLSLIGVTPCPSLNFTSPTSTVLPPGLTYTPRTKPTFATNRSIRVPGIRPSMRKFPLSSVFTSPGGSAALLREELERHVAVGEHVAVAVQDHLRPATGWPFASSSRPVTAGSGAMRTVTGPFSSPLTWITAASFFAGW